MTPQTSGMQDSRVPIRALFLSLLALTVPVAGALYFPSQVVEEVGVLLWLTPLVPPFLLTYYRGWRGASIGLAGGMAALALAHVLVVAGDLAAPDWSVVAGTVVLYMGVCVGVGVLGEVLRRERRLAESRALTDPLTGLPNRRHAGIVLDGAFAAASRGQPLAVTFFDVDHFKGFNDTFGHAAGDRVLETLAGVLHRCSRRMDLPARYGGEEFLVILANCGATGALAYAERVREELAATELPWGPVTVSAGVALYDPSMGSPEVLVAAADRALYAAKEGGRDCVRVVMPGQGEPVPPEEVEEQVGTPARPGPVDSAADPTIPNLSVRRGRGPEPREGADGGFLAPGGAGTRPVLDGEEVEARGVPSATARSPAPRILVVEDDEAARNAVGRVLRKLGYRVLTAPGPTRALQAFQEAGGAVDLVVTDVMMPGMSGVTMVGRMVESRPRIRALYISGYVQGEVEWKGAPGAVTAFLSKPMSVEDLAEKVREVLESEVESDVEAAHEERPLSLDA